VTSLYAVGLAVAVAVQTPPAARPPDAAGRISGVVIRRDTSRPIEDAIVRLVRWEGGFGQQLALARTDADGRFVVEGLKPGEYGLTVSAEAFVSLDFGQERPGQTARRILLKEGQHFDGADVALPPTTAIEGRVLDEFGDPAPGITVQVMRVQFASGSRRMAPVLGGPEYHPTDDLGRFRIINLPPGDYYLLALAGPFAGPHDPSGFAPTYFPGTRAATDAAPVRLDLGQDVPGLTFQLVPAPMSTVSGVLADDAGKPVAAGDVRFFQTTGDDVRSFVMGRIATGPDGFFELRNVAPGTYVIQAFGRPVGGGNLARAPFASHALTVSAGVDVMDLRLTIRTGATLRGRIMLDGDAPPPVANRVRVFPSPINFVSGPAMGGPPNTETRDDWTFEVQNLFGISTIRALSGSSQWFLKQVMRDGKVITDQPLDFRDGDIDGIEVTLTSRGPVLDGTVTDLDGPTAECSVLVFSTDPARWAFPSRYFAQERPADRGRFTIRGLPPGDYLVVAVPPVVGESWQDPEFLRQHVALATRVSLGESVTTSTSLKVVRR